MFNYTYTYRERSSRRLARNSDFPELGFIGETFTDLLNGRGFFKLHILYIAFTYIRYVTLPKDMTNNNK